MSARIPEAFRDLLTTPSFAALATINADGSPQVSPVWFDTEGERIVVNSAKGRVKDKNLRRDPRVALSIQDPANPYRYLGLQGRVVEITAQGADEHIDRMAKKYLGKDKYPFRQPGEVRVLYKIEIERAHTMG
jgi:PPOX class probable F420-dependent enzyme